MIRLCNISKHFEDFSIAVDESTDVSDIWQLAVFIRGCYSKFVIAEELLELIPMHSTSTGEDIIGEVENLMQKYEQLLNELFVFCDQWCTSIVRL
jgi:hypothetical protein